MRAKRTSLVHLIYFSRLALSSDPQIRAGQVGEITRHAQKKNEFSVITSFLLVEQNFAAQVIEGERTSVHETFNRIVGDDRHRDVQICEWREITKREFVNSCRSSIRSPTNDVHFAKANLLPMFQRGTPKASSHPRARARASGGGNVQAGHRPPLHLSGDRHVPFTAMAARSSFFIPYVQVDRRTPKSTARFMPQTMS